MKRLLALAALVLAALTAVGCGVFTAPAQPTAGAVTDIVNALVRRGMTVTDQVAGDPGCGDQVSSLHNNAVRYDVRPAGDTTSYAVYVLGWKSPATYDADKARYESCVQAEEAFTLGSVDVIEHLPWRAHGPGWPPALRQAVDAALTEAGGRPTSPQPD